MLYYNYNKDPQNPILVVKASTLMPGEPPYDLLHLGLRGRGRTCGPTRRSSSDLRDKLFIVIMVIMIIIAIIVIFASCMAEYHEARFQVRSMSIQRLFRQICHRHTASCIIDCCKAVTHQTFSKMPLVQGNQLQLQ